MGKTYMTNQINNSATIQEYAGAEIKNARGLFLKYADGKVVPASTAGENVIGVAIITNDETIAAGEAVDIQVKDIGLAMAGAAITKGAEIAAGADGKAAAAASGNFVIGTALEDAVAGQFFYFQMAKYVKA